MFFLLDDEATFIPPSPRSHVRLVDHYMNGSCCKHSACGNIFKGLTFPPWSCRRELDFWWGQAQAQAQAQDGGQQALSLHMLHRDRDRYPPLCFVPFLPFFPFLSLLLLPRPFAPPIELVGELTFAPQAVFAPQFSFPSSRTANGHGNPPLMLYFFVCALHLDLRAPPALTAWLSPALDPWHRLLVLW